MSELETGSRTGVGEDRERGTLGRRAVGCSGRARTLRCPREDRGRDPREDTEGKQQSVKNPTAPRKVQKSWGWAGPREDAERRTRALKVLRVPEEGQLT